MSAKRRKPEALPTYQELADLVSLLTEINIANIDTPTSRFVSCFTYGGPGNIPPHWQRALDARAALIENQIVKKEDRHGQQ